MVALLVAVIIACAANIAAAEAPVAFAGKTVTLVNNFPAGGSSDIWTRLLARHIGRFLPGSPTVVVQNRGGASGVVGYMWLANAAPADGLTIGALGGTLGSQEALGMLPKQAPSISALELLAGAQDTGVFFARREAVPDYPASLRALPRKPLIIANLSGDDSGQARDRAAMRLLKYNAGSDFHQIVAFRGGNEVYLAMSRGEIDFYGTRVAGYLGGIPVREVRDGRWVALWQAGLPKGDTELVRDPSLGTIPTFGELFKTIFGVDPAGDDWDYLRWYSVADSVARIVAAPPQTPRAYVQAWADAFRKMIVDPLFLQDQERLFQTVEPIMFGAEEAKLRIKQTLAMSAGARRASAQGK